MTTYKTTEYRQLWLNNEGTMIYPAPIPPTLPHPTECAAPSDADLEADGWVKVAEYTGTATQITMPIMSKELENVGKGWDFLGQALSMQTSHMPIDAALWDNSSLD